MRRRVGRNQHVYLVREQRTDPAELELLFDVQVDIGGAKVLRWLVRLTLPMRAPIELIIGNGRVVGVSRGFDEETLLRLVTLLGSADALASSGVVGRAVYVIRDWRKYGPGGRAWANVEKRDMAKGPFRNGTNCTLRAGAWPDVLPR